MPSTAPPSKSRTPAMPAAKPRRRVAVPTVPATSTKPDGSALPREERVRQLAYAYFEQRGGLDGNALDDWLLAEQAIDADELQATRSAADGH